MYIFDDFVDLGLKEGEKWTSDAHRQVAVRVLLSNPNVFDRDALNNGVQAINNIPGDRIKTVTLTELREEFKVYC